MKTLNVVYGSGTYHATVHGAYQYDHGVVLRIINLDVASQPEFHFGIDGIKTTISVVSTRDGEAVQATIPDIVLMQPRQVRCYIYVESGSSGYTTYEVRIPVIPRPKPAGYVMTPTESQNYNAMLAELNAAIDEAAELKEYTASVAAEVEAAKDAAETAKAAALAAADRAHTDANVVSAALDSSVRVDVDMGLNSTQQQVGRDNINVYSREEASASSKSAANNSAITSSIIPFWSEGAELPLGRANYPAESVGVIRHGGTLLLNGTASGRIRITVTGELARTATDASFNALSRTVDFVNGHEYEVEAKVISGSFTGTDLRCIVYSADSVGSAIIDPATGGGKERFAWSEDAKGIVALRILKDTTFTNCEICCVVTDITELNARTEDTFARYGVGFNRESIEQLQATHTQDMSNVSTSIQGLAEKDSEQESDIKAVSDRTASLSEVVSVLDGTLQTLDTEVEGLETEVASLAEDTGDAFAEACVRLSDADELAQMTDGHFKRIIWTNTTKVTTYSEVDGVISENENRPLGSGFIPCPKHLYLEFGTTSARIWLYFYTKNSDGTFTPNWDILSLTASTKLKNYVNSSSITRDVIHDIPEETYLQASVAVGDVRLYGWDGNRFGLPLCAGSAVVTTSGATDDMYSDGDSGIVFPGNSQYAITAGPKVVLRAGIGVKDGVSTYLSANPAEFYVFPSGYDYFVFRLAVRYGEEEKQTVIGDVSEYVSVACKTENKRLPETATKYTLDAAKEACDFSWVPGANMRVQGGGNPFKAGVRYNGIPYGSGWQIAHYVGWHVSPHTFVNAVADDASILMNEGCGDNNEAPYYSTVCSVFASMVAGWPYPITNDGMSVCPRVQLVRSLTPPIGAIWNNIGKIGSKHCVIPVRTDYTSDGVEIITAYEGLPAVTARTVRYGNIATDADKSGFKVATGEAYYDKYGTAAYHLDAVRDKSNIPYWDTEDVVVTGGDARPYRGDKSTYTSLMDNVMINIKNTSATMLYLADEAGTVTEIAINGATQVDVKPHLSGTGIYVVYTDTSDVQESFEYVVAEPVKYRIVDGLVVFDRADWWYAYVQFLPTMNNAYLPGTQCYINIPPRENGDYGEWLSRGEFTGARVAFYRGRYGAYVVPCQKDDALTLPDAVTQNDALVSAAVKLYVDKKIAELQLASNV